MDVERIVVKMLADASSYTRTMSDMEAKMASTVAKLVREGEKDPFAGLGKSARKAVDATKDAMAKLEAEERAAASRFRTAEASRIKDFEEKRAASLAKMVEVEKRHAEKFKALESAKIADFKNKQAEALKSFTESEARRDQVFKRRQESGRVEYFRRRDIWSKGYDQLRGKLEKAMPADDLHGRELSARNKMIAGILDEVATRQAEKDMRFYKKQDEAMRRHYEGRITRGKEFAAAGAEAVRREGERAAEDFRRFEERKAKRLLSYASATEDAKRKMAEKTDAEYKKLADRHASRMERLKERLIRDVVKGELRGPPPPPPPRTGRAGGGGSSEKASPDFMMGFVGGIAGGITAVAITSLMRAIYRLNYALAESGKQAVVTAMDYEVLQIQFEVMTGSAEKGKATMEELFDIAIKTPFRVKDVVAATKELTAFGFGVEDSIKYMKMLGDVSAGTGTPMHRLILAFGQTKVAGRLMGQEMRQFVNSNVPLIEELARVLGKPESQIKKMIENGRIGFDSVVKALNNLTGEGGRFALLTERMNKTAKGQWNALIDTIEISGARIAQVFIDEFGLKELFHDWQEWANETGKDTNQIGNFFRTVHQILLDVWYVVKLVFVGIMDIASAVTRWAEQNKGLISTLRFILILGTSIRLAVWAVTTAVRVLVSVLSFARMIFGINAVIALVGGIVTVVTAAGGAIIGFLGMIELAFGTLTALLVGVPILIVGIPAAIMGVGFLITKMFEDVGSGISKAFEDIGNTFKSVWSGVRDAMKANDLELAFKIVFKGIELAWKQLLAAMHAEVKVLWTNISRDKSLSTELAVLIDPTGGALEKAIREEEEIRMKALRNAARDDIKGRYAGDIDALQKELELLKRQAEAKAELISVSKEHRKVIEESAKAMGEAFQAAADMGKRNPLYFGDEAGRLGEFAGHRANLAAAAAWIESQNEIDFRNGIPNSAPQGVRATLEKYGVVADVMKYVNRGEKSPAEQRRNALGHLSALQADNTVGTVGLENRLRADHAAAHLSNIADGFKKMDRLVGGWFGMTKGVVGSLGVYNQGPVPYSISPESKTLAEKISQQYMRGVGPESHVFDNFMKSAKLIEEARTGLTPEYQELHKNAGFLSRIGYEALGKKNRALEEPEAEYGLLEEFDKVRKYVGNRTEGGPPMMLEGSAAAQETINRSQQQQVSVMEDVRTTLLAANAMQKSQLEYQRQAAEALRQLTGQKEPEAAKSAHPLADWFGFGD